MNMGRIGSNRTEYRINRIEPNQILIKKKDFGSNRTEYRLCRTEPDRIKKIPFVSASDVHRIIAIQQMKYYSSALDERLESLVYIRTR